MIDSKIKPAANPATAAEVASAPASMPEPAAAQRISYAAAASKSRVGPKPSAAGFEPRPVQATKFSTGRPASQPAVAPAPLEASMYMHYGRARQHFARCT